MPISIMYLNMNFYRVEKLRNLTNQNYYTSIYANEWSISLIMQKKTYFAFGFSHVNTWMLTLCVTNSFAYREGLNYYLRHSYCDLISIKVSQKSP